nr:oligosaccharide flippase family protein [Arthrobacter gengyunqii]
MRNLVWSFVERIFPRGASALVMVLLAAMATPSVVGIYALGILSLSLFQSVTDASIRQIAVRAVKSQSGRRFLSKYKNAVLSSGTVFLLACFFGIYLYLPSSLESHTWALMPLLAVPFISVLRVESVARLQLVNSWKSLARIQVVAAAVSLLVSIPLLLMTRSLWASSVQMLLTELIFTFLAVRHAHGLSPLEPGTSDGTAIAREYGQVSMYSALGWAQGQADRLFLTLFAGPAALGLYTFAQSLSRSVGDSLSTSTSNVLRPKLLVEKLSASEIRGRTEPLLIRAGFMSGISTIVVILATVLLFPLFLSDEWGPALNAAAIMSLAVGPTMLSWSITVVLIAMGRMRWAAPIKVLGVGMALPIALVAVADLEAAAFLVVGRDVLIMVLMLLVARSAIGWRTTFWFLLWLGALGALVGFIR